MMYQNKVFGPYFETLPDPPTECWWCDGWTEVEVASIIDAGGQVHSLPVPGQGNYVASYTITCPRCGGRGSEPELDPYENPEVP